MNEIRTLRLKILVISNLGGLSFLDFSLSQLSSYQEALLLWQSIFCDLSIPLKLWHLLSCPVDSHHLVLRARYSEFLIFPHWLHQSDAIVQNQFHTFQICDFIDSQHIDLEHCTILIGVSHQCIGSFNASCDLLLVFANKLIIDVVIMGYLRQKSNLDYVIFIQVRSISR